jgi:hypothetical protein
MTPKAISKRVIADRLETVRYLLGDLEAIQAAYRRWVTANPDKLDGAL